MEEKDKGNQVITEEGSDPEVTDGIYEPDGDEEHTHYHDEMSLPTPKTVARASKAFNEDGTIRRIIKAPKSSFVSTLIYLDGKPFDFTGREYLFPIYNRNSSRILLKTARQVEKTTFLANNLTVDSLVINYNKSLYVSPSHTQTRQFSNEKLRPAIEKSPFVKKYFQDHSVSTQVFEKGFTNGSYIFLRSAFRSADRTRGISSRNLCVKGDTMIYLSDGRAITVKDLVLEGPVGKRILTLNERTFELELDEVVSAQINPGRRMVRVTSDSGAFVELTEDHPVLTWDGWKHAGSLSTEDHILEFSTLPYCEAAPDLDEDDAFIASCLLGDGTHTDFSRVSFHTTNNELKDYFCDALGRKTKEFSVGSYERKNMADKPIVEHHVRIYGNRAGYKPKLEAWGLIGQRTENKSITFFHQLSTNKLVIAALNGFLATDGFITATYKPENKQSPLNFDLGYISTSRLLAIHVQLLWRKLGVYSSIRVRNYDNGVSKRDQFIVQIRDVRNFRKALAYLDVPGKKDKIKNAKDLLEKARGPDKTNLLPITNKQLIARIKKAGKTLAGFRREKNSNLGNNDCRTTASKVRAVGEFIKDRELLKVTNQDLVFQKVRSISEIPSEIVYDLTMKKNHNFFANMILVHNCLDEVQDFLGSEIPVILECTSHFPDARVLMAGTPKSHDNPIQTYWEETTQNEWLVPCSCGKWNFLDDANIGPTEHYRSGKLPPGPVCKKCGKPINVRSGQWMSTSPGKLIEGYRVPQLMVPWICGLYDQWERLLWKRDNYPIGQLYNEVLGLSYDSASKPITRDEIIEICDSYDLWDGSNLTPAMIAESKKFILTAGVDWGEGNDGSEKSPSGKIRNASYTVLTVGAYINQKQYAVKLIKKYEGREVDPDFVVKDIARICGALGVRLIGVDWGHGWGVNNHLSRLYGGNKVVQFQYLPKLKHRMKWDPIGYRYHLQRNFMMSELFFDMKNGLVRFPRWAQMERFAKDILGIYAEYVEFRREMKYDHKPTDPDDFFHSLHYSKLAADIHLGKSRKYTVDVVQSGV